MEHTIPNETGTASTSAQHARVESGGDNSGDHRRPSFSRQAMQPAQAMFSGSGRQREQSVGAWSMSSVGTGDGRGTPSSVLRSASRRTGKGGVSVGRAGLAGASSMKRRNDKHTLALRNIREFLKGRSCYDCLPVSFRLVVLDTKLIVKPALEIMWQAGIVSAPLWQSTSDTTPSETFTGPSSSAQDEAADVTASLRSTANIDRPISPTSHMVHSQPSMNASVSPSSSLTASEASAARSSGNKDSSARPTPAANGKAGFAGMLTVNDIIHLIQYYYQNSSYDNAAQDVERFRLEMLREIEQTLHVPPPPLLSIDPMRPIFDACQLLMKTHARRLPLLDHDEQTGMDVVVSVLTQYRVLKFIAMNCRETAGLRRSIRSLGVGTYIDSFRTGGMARSMTMSSAISSSRRSSNAAQSAVSPSHVSESPAAPSDTPLRGEQGSNVIPSFKQSESPPQDETSATRKGSIAFHPLATATLDTTVFDVVHVFSELGISGIPILDEDGFVVDLYETVDVIDLVRSSAYQSLDLTIRQALSRRSKDFPGVMTCSPDDSLATIFALLRVRRVHRILILEPEHETAEQPPTIDGAIDIEHERALHAGVANDTGAYGEPHAPLAAGAVADDTKRAQQLKQKQKDNGPEALLDIKRRKRGKLVGILCLSDVMRYIIGGTTESASVPTSHVPNVRSVRGGAGDASTAASSVDHAEASSISASSAALAAGKTLRPRKGSGESESSADGALASVSDAGISDASGGGDSAAGTDAPLGIATGTSTQPPAARFDPSDMPPTIEEHPIGEGTTPPPVDAAALHSTEQTPTQEKPIDASLEEQQP